MVCKNLDTWELISKDEYKLLCKSLGPTLPIIAISTIKRDKNGKLDRAKYRICVLENLNSHNWEKSDSFAPVLSKVELYFLINMAIKHRCVLKTGDVSQAFFKLTYKRMRNMY